jgi:hypothetical protein
MKPGLLPHMLEMFSDNDGLKSFKLCLDGKKVYLICLTFSELSSLTTSKNRRYEICYPGLT